MSTGSTKLVSFKAEFALSDDDLTAICIQADGAFLPSYTAEILAGTRTPSALVQARLALVTDTWDGGRIATTDW